MGDFRVRRGGAHVGEIGREMLGGGANVVYVCLGWARPRNTYNLMPFCLVAENLTYNLAYMPLYLGKHTLSDEM